MRLSENRTIDQMAELFQRNKSTISRHVKNIFECGELDESSTVAFFATVQNEGRREVERQIAFYNLDMIISVGYRVNCEPKQKLAFFTLFPLYSSSIERFNCSYRRIILNTYLFIKLDDARSITNNRKMKYNGKTAA